jgi:hypothetical protein
MIPTSRKPKLPTSLSYPVGAELVSEALADVPQASKLHISFGLFRPLLRKDGHMKPYPVLRANHSGPVMPPSLRWGLRVWSVPSEAKHDIKESLVAGGLARVRRWLEVRAGLSQTRQSLTVMYDKAQKHLTYNEGVG